MPLLEKRLDQSYPNATTDTIVYTVPSSTRTIVKNIVICNTTTEAINVRIFAVPVGLSAGVSTAIFYDYEIPKNFTFTKNMYLILHTEGDTIVVYVSAQGVTFTVSGAEVT